MHIYLWQIDPPPQSNIDVLNTATTNLAHLYIYRTMHIYPWQIDPLLPPIKHTSLENITSNQFHDRLTPSSPPIDHRSIEDHYIKYKFHI